MESSPKPLPLEADSVLTRARLFVALRNVGAEVARRWVAQQ